MASDKTMPVPFQIVSDFMMMVEKFQRDHVEYTNRKPYDESERWSWLDFLGGVYATGWNDGRSVQSYLATWQKPTPPAPAPTDGASVPTSGDMDALLDDVAQFAGEGAADLVRERIRQIHGEGYTQDHDADHTASMLAFAGLAYLHLAVGHAFSHAVEQWPFGDGFKPGTTRRNLERAGALIAAALDRLPAEDKS